MTDSLHPETITACLRCSEFESSCRTGHGSSALLPLNVEQDDEGVQHRGSIGVAHGSAEHLLSHEVRRDDEKCRSRSDKRNDPGDVHYDDFWSPSRNLRALANSGRCPSALLISSRYFR